MLTFHPLVQSKVSLENELHDDHLKEYLTGDMFLFMVPLAILIAISGVVTDIFRSLSYNRQSEDR